MRASPMRALLRALLALLLLAHAAARCTDTCATADDGSCDDGGADAHTAKCLVFDPRASWRSAELYQGRAGLETLERALTRSRSVA